MRAATTALVGDAELAVLALQLQETARSGCGRQTMAGKTPESMMMQMEPGLGPGGGGGGAAAIPAIMVKSGSSGTVAAKATSATAAKAVPLVN